MTVRCVADPWTVLFQAAKTSLEDAQSQGVRITKRTVRDVVRHMAGSGLPKADLLKIESDLIGIML